MKSEFEAVLVADLVQDHGSAAKKNIIGVIGGIQAQRFPVALIVGIYARIRLDWEDSEPERLPFTILNEDPGGEQAELVSGFLHAADDQSAGPPSGIAELCIPRVPVLAKQEGWQKILVNVNGSIGVASLQVSEGK